MGWFSRRNKDESGPLVGAPTGRGPADDPAVMDVSDASVGRPSAKPLTEAETARISSALEELAERGVDVDDLASIGAAYDAACSARVHGGPGDESREACEVFAIAIGEHLHRHSTLKWAVVTDTFGTDLGLAGARSETVVVPHNLVSARWMRRERGWIPGVVTHLLRLNTRR